VAFRPGPILDRLVADFASIRGIGVNDAYKQLAALAVLGLDAGYYDLLARLAARLSGPNAFVQAAVHVHTALAAAARVDPAQAREPARVRFAIKTVLEQLPDVDERVLTEIAKPLLVRLEVQGSGSHTEVREEEPAESAADAEKVRVVRGD
jgi:hypothetical protein